MGHWLMDTAGIGSIIVFTIGFSLLAAYLYTLRWIQTAPPDTPTPATTENPQEEESATAEAGGEQA